MMIVVLLYVELSLIKQSNHLTIKSSNN